MAKEVCVIRTPIAAHTFAALLGSGFSRVVKIELLHAPYVKRSKNRTKSQRPGQIFSKHESGERKRRKKGTDEPELRLGVRCRTPSASTRTALAWVRCALSQPVAAAPRHSRSGFSDTNGGGESELTIT